MLNALQGDTKVTLRQHLLSLQEKLNAGLIKGQQAESVKRTIEPLNSEINFTVPDCFYSLWFVHCRLVNYSAQEVKAVCDLYRVNLSISDLDLLIELRLQGG